MVYKNFSNYDIDIDKQTVYSMHKKRLLKVSKDAKGYNRCSVKDDFGNIYSFWHELLYCIVNNTTRDKIPYDKNGDRYEIDHIIPVREGGTDKMVNIRLVSHKDNMNNEHTKKHFSKIRRGGKISEEQKRKLIESRKGTHLSNESKEKISKANKGKPSWMKEKHHSDEAINKISEKMKGKKNFLGKHHSDETKEKYRNRFGKQVFQYSIDGELINVWPSAAEAGRNGYNKEAINHCCEGLTKTHKGFIWKH